MENREFKARRSGSKLKREQIHARWNKPSELRNQRSWAIDRVHGTPFGSLEVSHVRIHVIQLGHCIRLLFATIPSPLVPLELLWVPGKIEQADVAPIASHAHVVGSLHIWAWGKRPSNRLPTRFGRSALVTCRSACCGSLHPAV